MDISPTFPLPPVSLGIGVMEASARCWGSSPPCGTLPVLMCPVARRVRRGFVLILACHQALLLAGSLYWIFAAITGRPRQRHWRLSDRWPDIGMAPHIRNRLPTRRRPARMISTRRFQERPVCWPVCGPQTCDQTFDPVASHENRWRGKTKINGYGSASEARRAHRNQPARCGSLGGGSPERADHQDRTCRSRQGDDIPA